MMNTLALVLPALVSGLMGAAQAATVIVGSWRSEPWRPFRSFKTWLFVGWGFVMGLVAYVAAVASDGVTPPSNELTIGAALGGIFAGAISCLIFQIRVSQAGENGPRTLGTVVLDLLSCAATTNIRLQQGAIARDALHDLQLEEILLELPSVVLSTLDDKDGNLKGVLRQAQERIYSVVETDRDHAPTRIGIELLRVIPEEHLRRIVAEIVAYRNHAPDSRENDLEPGAS